MPFRSNYYMLLAVNCEDLCCAVCIARVVEISSFSSKECGVNNILIIYTEHVAVTYAFFFVSLLPLIGYLVTNYLPYILDQDVILLELFLSKEAYSVNFAWTYFQLFRS